MALAMAMAFALVQHDRRIPGCDRVHPSHTVCNKCGRDCRFEYDPGRRDGRRYTALRNRWTGMNHGASTLVVIYYVSTAAT